MRGNNLVPIEFEILIELPAKYVRVDEFPAEDTDPTSAGFNGDALIQIPPPPAVPAGPPGRDGSGRRQPTPGRGAPADAGAAAAAPRGHATGRGSAAGRRSRCAAAGWHDAAWRDAPRRGRCMSRAAADRRWIRGAPG